MIVIFLGVLASRDASAGRAAGVAFGEAYGLLVFFATGVLTSLPVFRPGAAGHSRIQRPLIGVRGASRPRGLIHA